MKYKLMKPFEERRILGLRQATFFDVLYITLFTLVVIGLIKHYDAQDTKLISPIPIINAQELTTPIKTPTPTPTPAYIIPEGKEDIAGYIKEVFGKHADKAFLLLTCENATLNPEATNYNSDDIGSVDYGIFQINSYWQGIRHDGKAQQFLLDPLINIRIAWRIYEDDGYSFKLWTCGRKFGI